MGNKFGSSKAASIERTMTEKVCLGTAIDLSATPRIGNYYVLLEVDPKQDYVDLSRRAWIRSIGRLTRGTGIPLDNGRETAHVKPGTILASTGFEFVSMAGVVCVWQR